jgi:L-alanine-DL-glutamate epimerase-like enolase superfamily enzyme
MKITNVSYLKFELEFNEPYTIAYETISNTTNFILKIDTSDGLTGWGCSAPDPQVTHESIQEVESGINDIIIPYLKGEDPTFYVKHIKAIKQKLGKSSSALAMVDMALHDIIARKADLPLFKLLGGYRESIPTSITIGIKPLKDTIEDAHRFFNQGFRIIKLKGGLDVQDDIHKIHALRENFGATLKLRFDGNQGYSVDQAVHFIKEVEHLEIEIFEQPTTIEAEEQLERVTNMVKVPVMADESIKTLHDAFRLASHQKIDMVNIKIQKVGGLLASQHINSVAKSAGMEVMVGCLDECALGISAGLHFALSRPNIEFADLDGHLDLVNDPFKNLFHLNNGILYPASFSGLGKINLG